jgi:acetyl-CoA/propionyl-CoA carboxylase biotin carboxyl carrier protein
MLRALEELEVEGIATTVPAHKAILGSPEFAAATHSTKWVEERLDLSGVAATPAAPAGPAEEGDGQAPRVRRDVDVEVNGRRYSVALWVPDVGPVVVAGTGAAGAGGRPRPKAAASSAHGGAAGAGQVTVPMQGTIVKVLVKVGDAVEVGRPLCVLEAMKMENNIEAGTAGTVSDIRVEPGSAVGAGDVVMVIE